MAVPVPPRLLEILQGEEDAALLTEAAAWVARTGHPDLDVPACVTEVEAMLAPVREGLGEGSATRERLLAVNALLFDRLGFAAPQGDYYDPRNSYLNEVLVRRCGIPITLSVLYLHAGRLAGLDMHGVSFPGHFLVRCEAPEGLIVLDPYHRGASLSLDDLVARLKLSQGEAASGRTVMELLGGVGTRDIVLRMLRNLKAIHLQARDWDHALTVVDWLVHAAPEAAPERRDRGLAYQELECARAALADYEAYLGQAADAEDVDDIRARTVELRKAVARLN
jgi:regulator of sirC expression with transglutaminase-like and TPR domain